MSTTHHAIVRPNESGLFEAEIGEHKIIMDSVSGEGSRAPTPKPLMLASLAGCTAIDVVALLQKMRVSYSDFSVKVEASLSEEHPKYYTATTLVYAIKVDESNRPQVEKAVTLSVEKYCGVHRMFEGFSTVEHRIDYL